MSRAPSFLLVLTFGLALGCSSSKEPVFPEDNAIDKSTAKPDDKESSAPQPASEALPKGTISRAELDQALMRGPAWLLAKVQTEEVLRQNKFVGWRLVSFPADWDGSGLQPGDVVTDVNGTSLERPDDLWTVWTAAAGADEIRIAFERNGAPSSTSLKIKGAATQTTKKALEEGSMIAPNARVGTSGYGPEGSPSRKFDTKVIGNSEPEETE